MDSRMRFDMHVTSVYAVTGPNKEKYVCMQIKDDYLEITDHYCAVYVHPIVGDGVSIGHPCCGIFSCTEPLQNNRHRFCKTHFEEHQKCAINGCNSPISDKDNTKTCSDPAHKSMEKKNKEKAEASFTLKEKYSKMQIAHPTEVFTSMDSESESMLSQSAEVEEHLEWYEVDGQGTISVFNEPELGTVGGGVDDEAAEKMEKMELNPCPSKSHSGNRVFKAQFGRRRTHNEQTLVRPCGIIYARATMFGAEAVSNFLVGYHFHNCEVSKLMNVHI